MFRYPAKHLLSVAAVLLVLGVLIPALMMFRVLPLSFGLSLLAYVLTVSGSFLGYLGILDLVIERRRRY